MANSKTGNFGFVKIEAPDIEEDIFIPASAVNGALDKDIVFVQITKEGEEGKKKEGSIFSIIEKGKDTFVGTIERYKKYYFLRPDNAKIPYDIVIPKSSLNGAQEGHKVIVKITRPKYDHEDIKGSVVEILGHENDVGIDILSIIKQYDVNIDFPKEVHEDLQKIDDVVTDIQNRTDIRSQYMVTIDGADAKDIDDAVSLEILDTGLYRLGVHIADVSHYVREGTNLDKEALARGTSIYPVDRVIPMLPHKLSNGVCSLNEGVDRLALSIVMDIDEKGDVISHKILETVINVDKKMTYDEVDMLLSTGESPQLLRDMEQLSNILREKRIVRGALDFALPEARVAINAKGKPTNIILRKRTIATSIIEEFMLIANETVAEEYHWLEHPFVFRNHAEPDKEKMEALGQFVAQFGYTFRSNKKSHTKSVQSILVKLAGTNEEGIISRVILKNMKQARYEATNAGHFGLSAKYYCHFTAPIRRYPDLQIHRIIKENINGTLTAEKVAHYTNILQSVPQLCSQKERTSEEIERETLNYKKVEYMQTKVGEVFEGIISSVTSWGIYVELPNTIEGMVSLSSIKDDHYIFEKDKHRVIGEHHKKVYNLGDTLNVVLVRANLEIRKLDFELWEEKSDEA